MGTVGYDTGIVGVRSREEIEVLIFLGFGGHRGFTTTSKEI